MQHLDGGDATHRGMPRGTLKNSLLSSNVHDNTLYDLDKDTVYSFFAEESEIRPRGVARNKGAIPDG